MLEVIDRERSKRLCQPALKRIDQAGDSCSGERDSRGERCSLRLCRLKANIVDDRQSRSRHRHTDQRRVSVGGVEPPFVPVYRTQAHSVATAWIEPPSSVAIRADRQRRASVGSVRQQAENGDYEFEELIGLHITGIVLKGLVEIQFGDQAQNLHIQIERLFQITGASGELVLIKY